MEHLDHLAHCGSVIFVVCNALKGHCNQNLDLLHIISSFYGVIDDLFDPCRHWNFSAHLLFHPRSQPSVLCLTSRAGIQHTYPRAPPCDHL
ncbi:hypothetical protein CRG98_049199 [Punica granatum]|uniref:Uncharacterized protein n=1 Tax=Punica granatum TaxID=22663 RepID=A0A2I0HFU8_PUNGR|nr:hypothetical protein CRG98_049199 [Punica granatum]